MPTAPTISTSTGIDDVVVDVDVDDDDGFARDSRPHATAWFDPFPPALVVKDVAVMVSPAPGNLGVTETMSALSEPMILMRGAIVDILDDLRYGRVQEPVMTVVVPLL